jgi:hypothetical protein
LFDYGSGCGSGLRNRGSLIASYDRVGSRMGISSIPPTLEWLYLPGAFGLFAYAIGDAKRFRRLLVLIFVLTALAVIGTMLGWWH